MTIYVERGYNRKEYPGVLKRYQRCSFMILVGIAVVKDKHDCFIINSDGEILAKAFSFHNNKEGFNFLYERIRAVSNASDKIKVRLEATGHYSYNLLGFLLDKDLPTFVINPLHTYLYERLKRIK